LFWAFEIGGFMQRAVVGKEDPEKVREDFHNKVVQLAQKRYG